MNETFDLTEGNFDNQKFYHLHLKKRRDCFVHKPENEKIRVTFTTEENDCYDCIYHYKTKEQIYDIIRNEHALDLQYAYIKDFDISEIENHADYKLMSFNAVHSFWDGAANFNGTQFGGDKVSFHDALFNKGNVIFDYAQFDGCDVNFIGARFGGGQVDFVGARFNNGEVCFNKAKFGNGEVNFYRTQFCNGEVSFDSSQFGNGNITFVFSEFVNNDVSFDNVRFGNSNISFNNANFGNSNVHFDFANFGNGDVSFADSLAKRIIFNKNTFSSHVDLRFKKIDELIIQDCIVEKTFKCESSVKFRKLSFLDTINLGQVFINWNKNNLFQSIENGYKIKYSLFEEEEIPFTSKEKASQFRMLKENFHNIGYYDDEDKAYRAYMKFKTNNIKRCWMKIFGLIGGYGTQAWKVILAALAVIAAFGGIFTVPMHSVKTDIEFSFTFFKGLYFSAITFLTIGYGDISPPTQSVALLAGIEGFLGLFLMSYFTVCVVRKLLR